MKTDTQNKYESSDTSLVSFLLVKGIRLLAVEKNQHNHFTFVLSDADRCRRLKNKYLNNAKAAALQLFFKREMLISEIKSSSSKFESSSGRTVSVRSDSK